MASDLEFVEYVCDQIGDAGAISLRKMFGEFAIYCNGKVISGNPRTEAQKKKSNSGETMKTNTVPTIAAQYHMRWTSHAAWFRLRYDRHPAFAAA